jgi:hypothetical protein
MRAVAITRVEVTRVAMISMVMMASKIAQTETNPIIH